MTKYWVVTVSKNHVDVGVQEGICQACHGKKAPLARMKTGDGIVFYSPKMAFEGKELCQAFTAIGTIADDEIYQHEMFPGFIPFRRRVNYLTDVRSASIHSLLNQLSFTKGKKSWGLPFRYGHFEITPDDYALIHTAMQQ